MNHNYHIKFENVLLRPLQQEDIESLRIWRNDPVNAKYLRKIQYITPEMQLKWFQKYLQDKDEVSFGIEETKELNRLVGSLSLHAFRNASCLLGKVLIGDPEAHGKLIGVNASKAAVKVAMEQMSIKTVKLYVFSDHLAAIKVYTHAGFVTVDEHVTNDGKNELIMMWEDK